MSHLQRRGNLDNYSHLSILTRRLLLIVDIVESVENLSPDNGDKSDITTSVVESVENLSPFFVDNSYIATGVVESVENLSPDNVEKWKKEKNEKNHQVIHIYCG